MMMQEEVSQRELESSLSRLAPLLARLKHAGSFEEAASLLLADLLRVCEEALQHSRFRQARLQRAIIHLRLEGAYQSLLILKHGERVAAGPGDDLSYLPSATAWRYIQEHRLPVAIDAQLDTFVAIGQDGVQQAILRDGARPSRDSDGQHTLDLMRHRQVTHILVIPLPGSGDTIVGQLSVEVSCPSAAGHAFIWPECVAILVGLVDLAAPYLARQPPAPSSQPSEEAGFPVVGKAMKSVIKNLRAFAQHDETILLLGATGTGKSRLARWCHDISPRRGSQLEVVDLNTIPRDLQQAELFGWRKGAFTGANRDHDGAVARASKGTLFLDEVDKLDLRAQASLLRLLEDNTFRPLGAARDERGDVRFLIGTNADLPREVAEGRFLGDLYYRINVLPVRLPALCARKDEIPFWTSFMLRRRSDAAGLPRPARVTPDAMQPLVSHDWPGNLRQLDNVVRRAFVLAAADTTLPGGGRGELIISRSHFAEALKMEQCADADVGLLSLMRAAAVAFVEHLIDKRRSEDKGGLDLDLGTSAFRSLVVIEAAERCESLKDAFHLLGKTNLVHSRNHQRAFRAAREHIEALRQADAAHEA